MASLSGYVGVTALLINLRGAGRVLQLVRFPIILLCLIVAFRSGSRGQLFAMVTAGILFLPLSRRIKNIGGFVGTAVGVAVILTLATYAYDLYAFQDNTNQRWNLGNMIDTYSGSRLGTSGILLSAWAEAGPIAWLIGLGVSASYSPDLIGFYPHLVMAETLGELGFVGFFLLWAVVIVAGRDLISIHRRVLEDPVARGFSAALGAIFLFEVILSFKQGSLLGSYTTLGLAVIIGRLADGCRRADPAGVGMIGGELRPLDLPAGYAPVAPPPSEQRPRRRVTPVFLPDNKPTAAGF